MTLRSHLQYSRLSTTAMVLLVALLLVAWSTSAVANEEPAHADLPDSEMQKLHAGEILVDVDREDSLTRGVVIGIIQAPINDVVPFVARCWEYAPWRDNISNTRLEKRIDDETIICSGTAETPFPASDRNGNFRVHNHVTNLDGRRAFVSTFDYIEGSGNMEDMFGYWVLTPYGPDNEHTLLKHVLNVDIGSWIPGFLIRWATGNTLPATVWGIRKQIDGSRSAPLYWGEYSYD